MLPNYRRTIMIDRDGVTERVSADLCVYASPPIDATRASTVTPRDLADKVIAGTKYAVERLLKHRRMEAGTTEFPIKWENYDTPTWTARTRVPEELMPRYAQRLRRCTGRDVTLNVNADINAYMGPFNRSFADYRRPARTD